jgi:hypothetical protein
LNSDKDRLPLNIEAEPHRSAGELLDRSTMTEELTKKVVAWASEIAGDAARLPSRQARDGYLDERHRELVAGAMAEGAAEEDAVILADACVSAARRIMTELLAHRASVPKGRA